MYAQKRTNSKLSLGATVPATSLSTACLPNLISALKFERDKISTFGNQKARADTFKRLIEKKSVKNNEFANTSCVRRKICHQT